MIIERTTSDGRRRYMVRVNNRACGTYGSLEEARTAEENGHRGRQTIAMKPELAFDVDPATGCWMWNRTLAVGYGRLYANGRHMCAHRFMYERDVGPIPPDMTIDHLCFTKACVNPAHMEVVTRAENVKRAWKQRMAARAEV